MSMVAKRVTRGSRIDRFHWHLLRHTFSVNYASVWQMRWRSGIEAPA
jgi:hypothetical protein